MKIYKLFVTVVLLGFLAGVSTDAVAEDSFISWLFSIDRKSEVAPVHNDTYSEECGACHVTYPPGLLPSASWRKLLAADALADHFGDNAELDDDVRTRILAFLEQNGADKSYYKRSRKIMASLKGAAPLRITEVPYIHDKHEEIPERLVKGNPEVKSLSFCNACHRQIGKFRFDDDTVDIPGYGNWTW